DLNTPNGQYVLTQDDVPDFRKTLPLAKIPGVEKVSAARIENLRLRTCGETQQRDLPMLPTRCCNVGRAIRERDQDIVARYVERERLLEPRGVRLTREEKI
ncbi:DNA polymerase IV, partial [Salmonella enterica subsp. enterica serovar Typhimurium]